MRQEIRFGGFGGQGIMLAGYILGRAAIAAGKWAVMTQSYGPEMRGARVAAAVVLDEGPIDYPKVSEPDVSVFMFQEAYDYYRDKTGEVLIYDQDLVQVEEDGGRKIFPIQANRIAEELGRRVVANIVMLGSLTAITGLLPVEAMEKAALQSVPKKALELNREAFRRGLEHGAKVLGDRR